MVLVAPYVAPAVAARRARCRRHDRRSARRHRRQRLQHHGRVARARARSAGHARRARRRAPRRAAISEARRERRRQRALDRSRRAANRAQYQLSKRQEKRARRREAAGLPPPQVIPAGPRRVAQRRQAAAGVSQGLSCRELPRERAAQAADAASATQARRDHARQIAASLVAEHGCQLVVEDSDLRGVGRTWGRALAAFSPGTLVAAIEREAAAVAASPASSAASCARRRAPPRCRSTACAALASPRRSATASTTASPVGCAAIAMPSPRRSPPACASSRTSPHPQRSITASPPRCSTTCARAAVLLDTLPDISQGTARRPVRVNRAFRPRRIVRRGEGAYTHATRCGWLGEPLAWRRVQPRMRLARYQTTSERTRMRTNLTGDCAETSTQLRDSS